MTSLQTLSYNGQLSFRVESRTGPTHTTASLVHLVGNFKVHLSYPLPDGIAENKEHTVTFREVSQTIVIIYSRCSFIGNRAWDGSYLHEFHLSSIYYWGGGGLLGIYLFRPIDHVASTIIQLH